MTAPLRGSASPAIATEGAKETARNALRTMNSRLVIILFALRSALRLHESLFPWLPLSLRSKILAMTVETTRDELSVHLERALLVSVSLPGRPWVSGDPLEELRGLATTAGAMVVGGLLQKRQRVIPGTYIGKGKVEELQQQVEAHEADVVIFDNDLSPAQVRNLEKTT